MDWLGQLAGLSSCCLGLGEEIRVAEDCSGVGPCGFVMKELGAKLGVRSRMVWSCDSDSTCRTVVERHSSCQHFFNDINMRVFDKHSMMARDIWGNMVCIDRYKQSLDLYTAGPSCRPFSTKGAQSGWANPESKSLFQVLRTIQVLQPRVSILENVPGLLSKKWRPGLEKLLSAVSSHDWQCYTVNSKDFGLPHHRGRVYIVLLRKQDFADTGRCFDAVRAFLQKARASFGPSPHIIPFLEKKGLPVRANVLQRAPAASCSCGVRTLCSEHLCRCRRCQHGRKPGLLCKWRTASVCARARPSHRRASKCLLKTWRRILQNRNLKTSPTFFTLCRARRLDADKLVKSPRVRVLLDTLAQTKNLLSPEVVVDVSQSISRSCMRGDGLVPALGCTSSQMFLPSKAAYLTAEQCLAVQGIFTSEWNFEGISEEKQFQMAGNAMSLPVIATFLVAALELISLSLHKSGAQ